MDRDELLKRISAVPVGMDIGVKIGDGYLDVVGIEPWANGKFMALVCHSADLRDLLLEWRMPTELRDRIAPARQQDSDPRPT
jgi:hypothetical protein